MNRNSSIRASYCAIRPCSRTCCASMTVRTRTPFISSSRRRTSDSIRSQRRPRLRPLRPHLRPLRRQTQRQQQQQQHRHCRPRRALQMNCGKNRKRPPSDYIYITPYSRFLWYQFTASETQQPPQPLACSLSTLPFSPKCNSRCSSASNWPCNSICRTSTRNT